MGREIFSNETEGEYPMKHHRILSKKNIVLCLTLLFAVAYALCYRYALAHTQKPLTMPLTERSLTGNWDISLAKNPI